MSLLDRLKTALAGGTRTEEDPSKRLYIIDTTQLSGTTGGRDSRSPRDQFKMLQWLARFVEREKIQAIAVMDGRPLNEAADGSVYNGVRVYYASKTSDIPGRVCELLEKHKGRHEVIVFTADRKLEAQTERAGGSVMRISTLRKALDNGGGSGGGDRSRSPRRGRRPRRRKSDSAQPAEKASDDRRKDSGVHDLIDLVD